MSIFGLDALPLRDTGYETILLGIPSAAVGALLALRLVGLDLTFIAMIGILLLIGVVKKNALMMIDFALDARRAGGLSPLEAIRQACLLRFRPIVMTTLCAIMGALPIALGIGAGAELRQPLDVAIVGGVFLRAITLFITPVLYLWFDSPGRRPIEARSTPLVAAPNAGEIRTRTAPRTADRGSGPKNGHGRAVGMVTVPETVEPVSVFRT